MDKLVNFVPGQSLFSLAPHLDSRDSTGLIIKYLMIGRTIFARVATLLSYSVQTITAYVNSGLRINLGLLPVVLAG